jgi:uncharacterized protein with GYD domain
MQTFVLLTKLSPESIGRLEDREQLGREWLETVKSHCPDVRWLEHYYLLGPFDFMDIYEAPSIEVAARVSMLTMQIGAVKAESWPAIPYRRFLEVVSQE